MPILALLPMFEKTPNVIVILPIRYCRKRGPKDDAKTDCNVGKHLPDEQPNVHTGIIVAIM